MFSNSEQIRKGACGMSITKGEKYRQTKRGPYHQECKKKGLSMTSPDKCADCGGTRGMLVHKVSLLDSDPWLEGVDDVHEFVPEMPASTEA